MKQVIVSLLSWAVVLVASFVVVTTFSLALMATGLLVAPSDSLLVQIAGENRIAQAAFLSSCGLPFGIVSVLLRNALASEESDTP